MTPTPKLRFVEREKPVGLTGMMVHVETILQQWWEDVIDAQLVNIPAPARVKPEVTQGEKWQLS